MNSIGIFVKGTCLAYLYPSKKGMWRFRSATPLKSVKRDGKEAEEVYRSQQTYASAEEALPFACRFITRTADIDVAKLSPSEIELRHVPYSARVSPADVPQHLLGQLAALLESSAMAPAIEDDEEEEEEVQKSGTPTAVAFNDTPAPQVEPESLPEEAADELF